MQNIAIIGATGLVGSKLLEQIVKHKSNSKVFVVSRNQPANLPDNIEHIPLNQGDYSFPDEISTAFCCLGTTMKKAGSKEAFRKVDFDMVTEFAQRAKDCGAKSFAIVCSIGANAKSRNFYLRTKGQVEDELKKFGFERLIIARPSLLLGKRNEKRFGEDIGKVLYKVFSFVFIGPLKKYKGINAEDVAKAMLVLSKQGKGTVIAESNALQLFSKKHIE